MWLQASLPARAGGIGIRRAAQLAPSAFLASAAGSSDLVRQILPPHLQETPNPFLESALTTWQQGHDDPPPPNPTSHHQRAWDAPHIRASVLVHLYVIPTAVSTAEKRWTTQEPMDLGVATARAAILVMPQSMMSSSDPSMLQTSLATWSPRACTDPMANDLMACLSSHGREGGC